MYFEIKRRTRRCQTFFHNYGLHHYYGNEFLEKNMVVYLKKDKDNEFDKEAISVNLAGLGKIG